VQAGVELGLKPLYTPVTSPDDFDRYEALQWRAAERWATAHQADPDRPEVLARTSDYRDLYLRWGREHLGWSLYLFMK
jgi:hypothetical protein